MLTPRVGFGFKYVVSGRQLGSDMEVPGGREGSWLGAEGNDAPKFERGPSCPASRSAVGERWAARTGCTGSDSACYGLQRDQLSSPAWLSRCAAPEAARPGGPGGDHCSFSRAADPAGLPRRCRWQGTILHVAGTGCHPTVSVTKSGSEFSAGNATTP